MLVVLEGFFLNKMAQIKKLCKLARGVKGKRRKTNGNITRDRCV
jgi:hypothetical protein